MNLNRENLLALILSYYADHNNWALNIQGKSKILTDNGKLARAATGAKSVGALIVTLCDSINISISEISNKCSIPMPRMVSIIQKNDMTDIESKTLWSILYSEYRKYYKI